EMALSSAQTQILNTYLNVKYDLLDIRNDLAVSTYTTDMSGIGLESDGSNRVFYSGGFILRDYGFLTDNGDYLYASHNGNDIVETPENTPESIYSRWSRIWYINIIDTNNNGGIVEIAFDLSAANISTMPINAVLLTRSNDSDDFSEINVIDTQYSETEIRFRVYISSLTNQAYYTLGMNPGFATLFDSEGFIEAEHMPRPYSMTVAAWINLTDTQKGEIISWADSDGISQAALYINDSKIVYKENDLYVVGNN
ncbi:hypothetical protein MHK_005217, partial [Candidatus Magnetomorum sp. HK-1]